MKKLIIINGTMEVGKSTVSDLLLKETENSISWQWQVLEYESVYSERGKYWNGSEKYYISAQIFFE